MAKSILIVEDDEQLRRLYCRALGNAGYPLTLASGTKEALRLLAAGSFDLVITDYELGDGTGAELIETARAAGAGCGDVIMVTGSVEKSELEELAERYRLKACFSKPFSVSELLESVIKALS